MSEANKMLSKLGYMCMVSTNNLIRWTFYAHDFKFEIDFLLEDKTVLFKPVLRKTGEIVENCGMSMEELKAIYKYCEDLGWI